MFCYYLHLHYQLNNIKMIFLLRNLVKQWYVALKKLHNSTPNRPILSHNLPWKCRIISDFQSLPIRRPVIVIINKFQESWLWANQHQSLLDLRNRDQIQPDGSPGLYADLLCVALATGCLLLESTKNLFICMFFRL